MIPSTWIPRPIPGLPRRAGGHGSRGARIALVLGVLLGVAACGDEHEYEPPDREKQVQRAADELDLSTFDTLRWESDSVRLVRGNEVFAAECRRCHGYLGRGDTDYADRHDLDPPSLVRPDWHLADHPDSMRRRIFIGHPDGMPTWGIGRISLREIDAVAYYIREQLRPEVLRDTATNRN